MGAEGPSSVLHEKSLMAIPPSKCAGVPLPFCSYDFHGCELLQSIVENRPCSTVTATSGTGSGETPVGAAGVVSVKLVTGAPNSSLSCPTVMFRVFLRTRS